ncbi:MAG: septum formation initiator family protein [Bacillota bacterium]
MHKLIAASGTLVISFLLVVVAVQWLQQYRLKAELTEQLALIEELESRNEDAGEEIERLHDLDYIELLARKHLGLVKPGETVFLIKD